MKMAKRVFIGVLVIAVIASCLAFTGTAATKEYTLDNYSEILEYYESPVMFGLDFEDQNAGESYTDNIINLGMAAQTVTVQNDANGNFLQFKGANPAAQCGNVFYNWNGEEAVSNFFLDFIVSGTQVAKVSVYNENDVAGDYFNTSSDCVLVNFDFTKGTVTYLNNGQSVTLTKADGSNYTVSKGTLYSVSMKYTGSKGMVDLTVTCVGNEADTATVEGFVAPFESVKNIKIGAEKREMQRASLVKLYEISAYAGSFKRNPNDSQSETEVALIDMEKLFNDPATPYADKVEISTIVIKLKSIYAFESQSYVPSLSYKSLMKSAIVLYADELQNCIDAIDPVAPYADRVANIQAYARYVDLMPLDYLFYVDTDLSTAIKNNLVVYAEEIAALEAIKYNSDSFIAAVELIDSNEVDYDTLSGWYDNASQYDPYDGYDGVPAAKDAFEKFAEKYNKMKTVGTDFITNTVIFVDTNNSFAVRFDAFNKASENLYTDDNYAGIDTFSIDGVGYAEARDAYYEEAPAMNKIIDDCESFISSVSSADYALYITAKENFLKDATALLDKIELSYPRMSDVKALYDLLVKDIDADKKAAAEYIAAVDATDGLQGTALVEAVEKAQILQVKGNILGIPGVTDANIKLSNLLVSTELDLGYSNQLVAIVSQISDAESITELYSLIRDALAIVDKAVDSYDGVVEAKAALAQAVKDYSANAAAMNAMLSSVNSAAIEISFGCN